MKVLRDSSMGIPLKLWLDDLEEGALQQALNLSRLPFAFHHIAIMPDAHQGYGMPIGGIMATHDVIVPNAVGVDIGCGMAAARTPLLVHDMQVGTLKLLLEEIRKRVPLGFTHHRTPQAWSNFDAAPDLPVIQRELKAARYQLGTLGGGNHFIEIQAGSDAHVWIMLHSGSRNFGLKIAQEYHAKAKTLCEQWYAAIPTADLSFLPMDSGGAEYWAAMQFALAFAKENRAQMMTAVHQALHEVTSLGIEGDVLDIHHNYAAMEHHFGKNVMVHRKGAVKAYENDQGIIPGSQGTSSYIVRGLGNPESFMSSSHGAGRKLGRGAAQRTLLLKDEQRKLDERGILHSLRGVKDLDEAAGAYKDIDVVMDQQADLVEIVVQLQPLAVIKG